MLGTWTLRFVVVALVLEVILKKPFGGSGALHGLCYKCRTLSRA